MSNSFTIEGSNSLIVDFFECGLNSILYQRGLYTEDEFELTTKYGLKIQMTTNSELLTYIHKLSEQLKIWLSQDKVEQIVIVIQSKDTLQVLERWIFHININDQTDISPERLAMLQETTEKQIRSFIRQITASTSFLPELDVDDCTFNVLIYTKKDVQVPTTWGNCGPHLINDGGEDVRLNSFKTVNHTVDTFVAYRLDENTM